MAFQRVDTTIAITSRNTRGKGYNSMRRRFREMFHEQFRGGHNLVNVVGEIACDHDNPKQMEAIKFAAQYGFGLPEKLDTEQVIVLAERMVQRQIEDEQRRALSPVDVEVKT